jgi:hypothetical protein
MLPAVYCCVWDQFCVETRDRWIDVLGGPAERKLREVHVCQFAVICTACQWFLQASGAIANSLHRLVQIFAKIDPAFDSPQNHDLSLFHNTPSAAKSKPMKAQYLQYSVEKRTLDGSTLF